MQHKQAGLYEFLKSRSAKFFSGTAGTKTVVKIVTLGLLVILSLLAIGYILVSSSFFNPSLKPDNDAAGTICAFFAVLFFACIACYALYLFLGTGGVYNTRPFRSAREVMRKVKEFFPRYLQGLLLPRAKRFKAGRDAGAGMRLQQPGTARGWKSFTPAAVLYNEYNAKSHYNTLAANARLLFTVSVIVVVSRLFIYFTGYIAYVYFKKADMGFFDLFKTIWVRWDSNHYIFLAENWYTNLGDDRLRIVFFPLYSLLVKFFNLFIPNTIASGVIVSNCCLTGACFYLVKLVELDYGRETGFRVVKYVLIYPFSFFLGIVYTESLFLMLLVMFFYYLRKKEWLLAGVAGFLASLTRLYGVLLLVPACCEILLSREFKLFFQPGGWKKSWRHFLKILLCVLAVPAGIGFYLYINKEITGSWFMFLEYQKNHWYNGFGFLGDTLKGIVSAVFHPLGDSNSQICIWWPALLSFILALLTMFYGIRKIRITYLVFMLVYTFISYSPTWPISVERYMLVLFPMYIPLALLGRKKGVDTAITVVSAALLCYCIFLFTVIGFVY